MEGGDSLPHSPPRKRARGQEYISLSSLSAQSGVWWVSSFWRPSLITTENTLKLYKLNQMSEKRSGQSAGLYYNLIGCDDEPRGVNTHSAAAPGPLGWVDGVGAQTDGEIRLFFF